MDEITPAIAEAVAGAWALSLNGEVLKSDMICRYSYERL
jgi:hypothetical protein